MLGQEHPWTVFMQSLSHLLLDFQPWICVAFHICGNVVTVFLNIYLGSYWQTQEEVWMSRPLAERRRPHSLITFLSPDSGALTTAVTCLQSGVTRATQVSLSPTKHEWMAIPRVLCLTAPMDYEDADQQIATCVQVLWQKSCQLLGDTKRFVVLLLHSLYKHCEI